MHLVIAKDLLMDLMMVRPKDLRWVIQMVKYLMKYLILLKDWLMETRMEILMDLHWEKLMRLEIVKDLMMVMPMAIMMRLDSGLVRHSDLLKVILKQMVIEMVRLNYYLK